MIVFTWLYRLDSLPTFPSSFLYIVVVHFFFLDEKQHQQQQLSQSSSNDDDRIRLQEVYSHWRLHHHVSTRRSFKIVGLCRRRYMTQCDALELYDQRQRIHRFFFSFFSLYLIECVRRKTKKLQVGRQDKKINYHCVVFVFTQVCGHTLVTHTQRHHSSHFLDFGLFSV